MNSFYYRLRLCGAWLLVVPALLADPLDAWYQRSTNALHNVTYGNGLFVGVGFRGLILTSPTGEVWSQQVSGAETAELHGVTYGNGTFVAVGQEFVHSSYVSAILTSPDGTNWTRQITQTACQLNDVAFGNGRFVAVAYRQSTYDPNVLLSFDGTAWQPYSFAWETGDGILPYPGSYLSSVTFAKGVFVAVGCLYDSIWTSTGGSTWTSRGQSGHELFSDVTWGNGVFVAVGSEGPPIVSTNSRDWTWTMPNDWAMGNCSGIGFGNGTFVALAVLGAGIYSSQDGVAWTKRNVTTNFNQFGKVVYGNGAFLCVGDRGIFQSENMITPQLMPLGPLAGGGFPLRVFGEVGRGYRVQASSNLIDWASVWSYTNSEPSVDYTDMSASNHLHRFYRAVTP